MENNIIKAGTKVVFKAEAGMVGTDTCEFFILLNDMTKEQLSDEAWQFGVNHAESYGVYPKPYYFDAEEVEEEDEEEDCYSDNIEGWYEIYEADKHDMLRVGGGNYFQEI